MDSSETRSFCGIRAKAARSRPAAGQSPQCDGGAPADPECEASMELGEEGRAFYLACRRRAMPVWSGVVAVGRQDGSSSANSRPKARCFWRRKTVPVSSMATTTSNCRSPAEWAFLAVFYPAVLAFHVIYKYPHWLLPAGADPRTFYLLGKNPGFWYASLYTALVAGTCLWVLAANRNRYQRSKKKEPLSPYQRAKFTSILLCGEHRLFISCPYILPALLQPGGFFDDPAKVASKASGCLRLAGVPKRGHGGIRVPGDPRRGLVLRQALLQLVLFLRQSGRGRGRVAVGRRWVRLHTPRGETARRWEVIQVYVLAFSVFFGDNVAFRRTEFVFGADIARHVALDATGPADRLRFRLGSGHRSVPHSGTAHLVPLWLPSGARDETLRQVQPQSFRRRTQRPVPRIGVFARRLARWASTWLALPTATRSRSKSPSGSIQRPASAAVVASTPARSTLCRSRRSAVQDWRIVAGRNKT